MRATGAFASLRFSLRACGPPLTAEGGWSPAEAGVRRSFRSLTFATQPVAARTRASVETRARVRMISPLVRQDDVAELDVGSVVHDLCLPRALRELRPVVPAVDGLLVVARVAERPAVVLIARE